MAQENEISVWEIKFPEHSPENRFPLYNLYKIPLAQANFPLAHKNALVLASGLDCICLTTTHVLQDILAVLIGERASVCFPAWIWHFFLK